MLASRETDPPAGFVQLQIAGLSEAMIVARTMIAGQSTVGGSMDRVDERTEPLSRLLAGPNSLGEGCRGAAPPRRAGAPVRSRPAEAFASPGSRRERA